MIYFDNNATTQLDPRVASRIHYVNSLRLANPASQHGAGRTARNIVEESRDQLATLLGATLGRTESDPFVFTSGGTEANNLALSGLIESVKGVVIVSAIEHPSLLATAEHWDRRGRIVRHLPVTLDGVVQLQTLREWIDELGPPSSGNASSGIALVSIMLANNETGVVQPVAEAAALCRAAGILIHTDAVQAVGKIPVSFSQLQVDAMTITPHKFFGPVGIGGLLLRHGVHLDAQLWGGFQQSALRPGTESAPLAAGMACAAQLAIDEMPQRAPCVEHLRAAFEKKILEVCPNATILGQNVDRIPNTTSVAFPGLNRQSLQMALDLAGVACSTGSACASGSSQPSHVIMAMHQPQEIIDSAIRFSLSHETSHQEIQSVVSILAKFTSRM